MIGTYKLETIIENVLFEAHVPKARKLARKCVDAISPYLESEPMNQDLRTEFLARGGSTETIKMYDKICKVMAFDMMPLTDSACEVYKWIAEQEAKGQKFETFAAWARGSERAQYIRKYRKDAGNIRNDWALVFPNKTDGNTRMVERL